MYSACSTRHQAPGRFKRSCAMVAMRAFDLSGADRQIIGQGFAVGEFQVTRNEFAAFVKATGYDGCNPK